MRRRRLPLAYRGGLIDSSASEPASCSLERGTLGSADPVGVRVRELERHHTALPASSRCLVHARAERGGVDEPVGGVGRTAGLADDELVELEAVLGDLEEGRSREGRSGLVDEAVAVLVETLVVELDIVLYRASDKYPV